jgi:hypothetical protein
MPNDKNKELSPGDIKNKQMMADLSKQAIESGAAYDYNKIQAENPVSDNKYKGIEAAYVVKPDNKPVDNNPYKGIIFGLFAASLVYVMMLWVKKMRS